jgi:hypothetical protein
MATPSRPMKLMSNMLSDACSEPEIQIHLPEKLEINTSTAVRKFLCGFVYLTLYCII